jgi:excinuclease ABC subunit C
VTLSEDLKNQIRALPDTPGVYRYFDKEGTLIYVGKAKSLRKRVGSYFTKKDGVDRKTLRLIISIRNIEYTVVNSEFEALLLENNLIKQYQPRYNINLKDDKTYPYILVTNDQFPKIYPTRRRIKGAGQYYGPYASVQTMRALLELIRKLFFIRTCNLPLTQESIEAGKFKVCLEYHIGNCKGPCQAYQTEEDYSGDVKSAVSILKGNLGPAKAYFRTRMQEYSADMEFEKAQRVKERLDLLERHESRSLIVNPDTGNLDVATILNDSNGTSVFVNYLQITQGIVMNSDTKELKRKLEETEAEMLLMALVDFRNRFESDSKEIITNVELEFTLPGMRQMVPVQGEKKKLIDLSLKNAIYYKHNREEKQKENAARTTPNQRILLKLQQDLRLKDFPDHIECFDNSNMQGTNAVAAMVCFKNGVPSKKDYRHFNIKTVEGPDDFASMAEIVLRRYTRQLDEAQPLPKLIVVDGGKGQLSAAVESLKALNLYGKVPIIGIAKRLEELYYPEDPYPLHLEKKSESLKLIQQMRDEAHRFGITHHRDKRSKASLALKVETVKGLGPKTILKVQQHFKTLRNITPDRFGELEQMIGRSKAALVIAHLQGEGS